MPNILIVIPLIAAGVLGWYLNRAPDSQFGFFSAAIIFFGGLVLADSLVGQQTLVFLTFLVVFCAFGFIMKSNVGRRWS